MEQFKRAKVVMLPGKKSEICLANNKLCEVDKSTYELSHIKTQHLYIISDDEIKEGNSILNTKTGKIEKELSKDEIRLFWEKEWKVIISSTNKSLGLAQPSQQFIKKFIEEYNKSNIITYVLVEYEEDTCSRCKGEGTEIIAILGERPCLKCKGDGILSKNIKLKINPKDNTITIKKVKDSWNREELIELFHQFGSEATSKQISFNHIPFEFVADKVEIDKWIEKNL